MFDFFLILVGESGSGKSSVAAVLEEKYGFTQVQSYTDRPRRRPDETGHTFIREDEMDKIEDVVAATVFDGHRYCTTRQQVDAADVAIFDPLGAKYFRTSYTGAKTPVIVFLDVNERERYKRMRKRGDARLVAHKRIKHDAAMFAGAREIADYVVANDDVDECAISILIIIAKLMLEKQLRDDEAAIKQKVEA